MIPDARDHIEKAREFLRKAQDMLADDWPDEAARAAYFAAFHAAKALIVSRTGKDVKSHKGTHVEFARLTRYEPLLDRELRGFLARGYNFKTVADYETGGGSDLSQAAANAAIQTATRLVDVMVQLLS